MADLMSILPPAHPQGLLETVTWGSGLQGLEPEWRVEPPGTPAPPSTGSPALGQAVLPLPGLSEGRTATKGGDRPHIDFRTRSLFLPPCSWNLSCPDVHEGWGVVVGMGFYEAVGSPVIQDLWGRGQGSSCRCCRLLAAEE